MQQTAPITSPPPSTSASASPSGSTRRAPGVRRNTGTGRRRRSSVFSEAPLPTAPPTGSTGPALAPGPLRGDASNTATGAAPLTAPDSLRDQGVIGMQLHQQGAGAELRLRWGQGAGVVEATLKETGRGVEIQLAAGPDQQRLLHRVAETLASGRGTNGFELDGVEVDADADLDASRLANPQRDPNQPRHRAPDDSPEDDPSDPAARPLRRRSRRSPTVPRLDAGAGAGARASTSYCR